MILIDIYYIDIRKKNTHNRKNSIYLKIIMNHGSKLFTPPKDWQLPADPQMLHLVL